LRREVHGKSVAEVIVVIFASRIASAQPGEYGFKLLDQRIPFAMPRSLHLHGDLLQWVRMLNP
jgi:hypothetical protein